MTTCAEASPISKPGPTGILSRFGIVSLFLALGLFVYFPAILSYFACDDFLHLATVIERGIPFLPSEGTGGFLRPVVGLSFWLEYALWGRNPLGYHLVNVLLHVLNSLLVVELCRILLTADGGQRLSFTAVAAGLLFLLMSCHAEPVSWISGRTDVLATSFMLLGLCVFCSGLQRGSAPRLGLSLVALSLALLAKESALSLPFLLALCGFYLYTSGAVPVLQRRSALLLVANGVVLLLYLLYRRWMLGVFIGGYGARGHLRYSYELLAQAMSRHVWRTFLPPVPPGVAPWITPILPWLGPLFFLGMVLLFFLLLRRAVRHRRPGITLLLFSAFWAALLPVINIRVQWTDPEGERFLYLASAFAAIGLAVAVAHISSRTARLGVLTGLCLFQGGFLMLGVLQWHTAGAIAQSVVMGIQAQENPGHVILVNKPDGYRGTLVLRSGLPEALRYFGKPAHTPPPVEVLYAVTINQRDFGFRLTNPSAPADAYRLEATDGTSYLVEEDRPDRIETLSHDDGSATFRFRKPLRDETLLLYDAWHVRSIPYQRLPVP